MRAWSFALLGCSLFLALPAPAFACKCAPPPPAQQALHDASAVFEGRITSITTDSSAEQPVLVVKLEAVRSWKGVESESVTVRTSTESAACGYPFEAGQSYLVYATESEGLLRVSHCGRTRLITDAAEDLASIGMGVVPVAPRAPVEPAADGGKQTGTPAAAASAPVQNAPRAGGCASCSLGHAPAPLSAASALWLSALALVVTRRARKHQARKH